MEVYQDARDHGGYPDKRDNEYGEPYQEIDGQVPGIASHCYEINTPVVALNRYTFISLPDVIVTV